MSRHLLECFFFGIAPRLLEWSCGYVGGPSGLLVDLFPTLLQEILRLCQDGLALMGD